MSKEQFNVEKIAVNHHVWHQDRTSSLCRVLEVRWNLQGRCETEILTWNDFNRSPIFPLNNGTEQVSKYDGFAHKIPKVHESGQGALLPGIASIGRYRFFARFPQSRDIYRRSQCTTDRATRRAISRRFYRAFIMIPETPRGSCC